MGSNGKTEIRDLTTYEKSALLGYFRNGMTYQEIALLMGISVEYVQMILTNYFENKKS